MGTTAIALKGAFLGQCLQGCDRRRYYVIYVNVLKKDVIFYFEDIIRYFCQNETLFLSILDVIFIILCEMQCFCRRCQ